MWPFSIEATSTIYQYSSIAAILAGIISVTSGALTFISSNILSGDTDLKIASAQKISAEANETAALANKQTEEIRNKNIELSLRLEQEQTKRIELQQSLGPRSIDHHLRDSIASASSTYNICRTIIIRPGSHEQEVIDYAKKIHETLHKLGVHTELQAPSMINHGITGVGANIFEGIDSAEIKSLLNKTKIANHINYTKSENTKYGAILTVYSKAPHL